MLAYGLDVPGYLAIASLLVSAASLLIRKKPKVANLDDALQSVATQGAFIPLVIGRQRVGPIFAWVEDATPGLAALAPQNRNLNLGGGNSMVGTQGSFGKGGGGVPQQPSYLENALHLLCVGPASSLRAIYQNGEVIWSGNIDPLSHPSGSLLPAGDSNGSEGAFEVHWGFPDDPILTDLQNSKYHGLAVRYSHVMKILWKPKNLGQSRQWPRLEYEVTCPCYSNIASTPSEIPLEGDDSKPTFGDVFQPDTLADLYAVNQGAVDRTWRVEFWFAGSRSATREVILSEKDLDTAQDDLTPLFVSGGILKIRTSDRTATPIGGLTSQFGESIAWLLPSNNEWRYFWIIRSYRTVFTDNGAIFTSVVLGPEVDSSSLRNNQTDPPYVAGTDPSGNGRRLGNVRPVSIANSDGINAVHIVDQFLFARYPYGCGKDRSQFDARSIEVSAEIAQAEKIRGTAIVSDGDGGKGVLSSICQDLGLFIVWDVQVGQFVFKMVRYEETVVDLPEGIVVEAPEMLAVQGIRPADVLAFTFKDRERNYREFPVRVDDSGQIEDTQSQRAKKIPIEVTSDRDSVTRLVPRRQQEAMANLVSMTWKTKNSTSQACPGQRFTASAIEGAGMQFLITAVKRDLNSSEVALDTVLDAYNPPFIEEPAFANRLTATTDRADVEQVSAFDAFEMPRVLSSERIEMLFLSSRTNSRTQSSIVWGSRDGLQFSILGNCPIVVSGVLVDALSADGPCFSPGSIEVDFLGNEDVSSLFDLSIDTDGWRAGKQIMLIGSELIFVQKGENGHPDTLTGLIRGRCSTLMTSHAAGTRFYILPASFVVTIVNTMFVAGTELHFKAQAATRNRTADLGLLEPKSVTVQGLAFRPLPVLAIRQSSLRPDYPIGAASVDLTWNYFSDEFQKTGLGTQPLGAASGQSPPRGYFLVEFGDQKIQIDTNSVSILLADRSVLDTLPSWDVTITHVEGSFSSDPRTLTLVPA